MLIEMSSCFILHIQLHDKKKEIEREKIIRKKFKIKYKIKWKNIPNCQMGKCGQGETNISS